MAGRDHKIVRRAQALAELSRLSDQLAERLVIEVPAVNVTGRDAELAEIQRIENVNELLSKVLEAGEAQPAAKPPAKKHGANK